MPRDSDFVFWKPRTVSRTAPAPAPKPIGGGSGTAPPIPESAKPKPIGSVLTGELTPLLGVGGPAGALRRLFRPASQLRVGG